MLLYQQINLILLLLGCLLSLVIIVSHALRVQKLPAAAPAENELFPTKSDTVCCVLFFLLLVFFNLPSMITPESDDEKISGLSSLYSLVLTSVFYLPILIRMFSVSRCNLAPGMGFSRISPIELLRKHLLWVILLPIVTGTVLEICGFSSFLHEWTSTPITQHIISSAIETDSTLARICIVVLSVVIAPVAEECFFRGFLYNILKGISGKMVGALVSSLFFAALHGSLVQFIPLFVFALLQCGFYERTRTLVAPIVAHVLFNLPATIVILLSPAYAITP